MLAKKTALPFFFGKPLQAVDKLLDGLPYQFRPACVRPLLVGHQLINAFESVFINSDCNSFHIEKYSAKSTVHTIVKNLRSSERWRFSDGNFMARAAFRSSHVA